MGLTEETERRLAERDGNNEDEDNSRLEDDSTQTGRSTLGDITNDSRLASGPGGDVTNDSRMASGDEEVPGSPVLKKKKVVRKLGTTATASRMLCSSAETSQK